VLKADAFPVVVGGDHSITYPSATAVACKYGWGKVGLLHFDAHADAADSIEGNLHSHGTPMRRLIESRAIRGRNFVQVGLQGYWPPPAVFDWMREQEMTWHLMHEVWDRGMRPVIADAIALAGDGCDWLYLFVDIDVLDPGFAPGTGTPEPCGMNPADLLRAVRSIALETPLVAMDVVEVSPPHDLWLPVLAWNATSTGPAGQPGSAGPPQVKVAAGAGPDRLTTTGTQTITATAAASTRLSRRPARTKRRWRTGTPGDRTCVAGLLDAASGSASAQRSPPRSARPPQPSESRPGRRGIAVRQATRTVGYRKIRTSPAR
jgi:hypothetical protein